jgi:ribose 5-phosphate isomerase A
VTEHEEPTVGDDAKRAAGRAAAALVEDGMRLGLGTGSTNAFFLDALAERDLDVAGIPTSEATAARCRELGIGLLDPATTDRLDLAVDGADEIDPALTLIKGGGGAHLREKVVASMADRFVVIATPDKVVDRLADAFPLPVEVVPFAIDPVERSLAGLGFSVVRRTDNGELVRTDNGNLLLDCRLPGGIEDPAVMMVTLALLPGVADTGLFVDMADLALLGREDGSVERMEVPADA